MRKSPQFLARNGNLCNFGLFDLALAHTQLGCWLCAGHLGGRANDIFALPRPAALLSLGQELHLAEGTSQSLEQQFGTIFRPICDSTRSHCCYLDKNWNSICLSHERTWGILFKSRYTNVRIIIIFSSEFGCHGNSLGSLENWSRRPKNLTFHVKIPRFLARNWYRPKCNFGLFLFKFGCHGNSLGSLKNSDSVLKFTSPEIPTVHAKNFSSFCGELMSAIFCRNLVAMATALTPVKFYIPYSNSPTPKTF